MVVIDDGSTDETGQIATAAGVQLSRRGMPASAQPAMLGSIWHGENLSSFSTRTTSCCPTPLSRALNCSRDALRFRASCVGANPWTLTVDRCRPCTLRSGRLTYIASGCGATSSGPPVPHFSNRCNPRHRRLSPDLAPAADYAVYLTLARKAAVVFDGEKWWGTDNTTATCHAILCSCSWRRSACYGASGVTSRQILRIFGPASDCGGITTVNRLSNACGASDGPASRAPGRRRRCSR